jgi:hypothetical protein
MNKVRIPTVALATLVFGGACGEDEKSSDKQGAKTGAQENPIDVSDQRIAQLSQDLCKSTLACDAEGQSEAECERTSKEFFAEYASLSDECFDLFLDYYECYAQLDCSEVEALDEDESADPCDYAQLEKLCGDELDALEQENQADDDTESGG